jgi:hypothetical protein
MEQEKFKITEFEQRRLTIDLLIRTTFEMQLNRELIMLAMSKFSKEPDKAFSKMQDSVVPRYKQLSQLLRERIFEHYGHIDLTDILPPEK